jgi:hypothetical protein
MKDVVSCSFSVVRENKQLQRRNTGVSPLRRAKGRAAPVEMTGDGWYWMGFHLAVGGDGSL